MELKTVASNLWHDAVSTIIYFFSFFSWAQWTLKSHLPTYLSASVSVTAEQLLLWNYFHQTKERNILKETFYDMIWQADQEKQAG